MNTIQDRYRRFVAVLVAYDFGAEGGAWRSIHAYKRFLEQRGTPVHEVDMRTKGSSKQLLAACLFSPRLVFNGLYTLMHWKCLLLALLRRDSCIYLHETEWKLDEFKSVAPVKYRIFSYILRRNPILCVSKDAADLYRRRYQAKQTYVVYELPEVAQAPLYEENLRHILMVGTIEPRKGVELFSKVADLASEKGLPCRFHWIGGKGTQSDIYMSKHVTWHGWTGNTQMHLSKASLFFLSSEDDPCPLAALEALLRGVPCVAYVKTGTAEIVQQLDVGAVYESRKPEEVLMTIEQTLSTGMLSDEKMASVRDFLAPEQFHRRMNLAIKSAMGN